MMILSLNDDLRLKGWKVERLSFCGRKSDFFYILNNTPSEVSAAGMKQGVRRLPVKTVSSRRSTQVLPAEGQPGPSDNDDDHADDHDDDNNYDDDDDKSPPLMMILAT